jgi:hypothetical protein
VYKHTKKKEKLKTLPKQRPITATPLANCVQIMEYYSDHKIYFKELCLYNEYF